MWKTQVGGKKTKNMNTVSQVRQVTAGMGGLFHAQQPCEPWASSLVTLSCSFLTCVLRTASPTTSEKQWGPSEIRYMKQLTIWKLQRHVSYCKYISTTISGSDWIGQNHLVILQIFNRTLTLCQSFFPSMLNTKRNDFCHSIVHCLELNMKDFEERNKATRILKKRVIDFGSGKL